MRLSPRVRRFLVVLDLYADGLARGAGQATGWALVIVVAWKCAA